MSGASSTGSFDDGCEGSTQLDTITELMSRTYSPFHEPSRLRVADPRSGPRLCEAQRFMVPMRDRKVVEALHEPPLSGPSATLSPPCGERAGRGVPIRFMVPMHTRKRKGAFHEP